MLLTLDEMSDKVIAIIEEKFTLVRGIFMPDGLKERFDCWKLRMFVRLFRPDICLKHNCLKYQPWLGTSRLDCDECMREQHEANARKVQLRLEANEQAKRLHEVATEEILNGLKYCARKK